jgi:hypothetical protein
VETDNRYYEALKKTVKIFNGDTVIFKSRPECFHKEMAGLKPNTIRYLEGEELALFKQYQDQLKTINIQHTQSPMRFTRTLSDISTLSFIDEQAVGEWVLLSWRIQ